MSFAKTCLSSFSRGFSLIEILAVISLVLVLGSIVMASIGSSVRKADSVKCAAHLRQIGVGIQTYAAENNSALPGPLYSGQSASLAGGGLVSYLAPYLAFSVIDGTAPLFECPAWKKNPTRTASSFPYYCGTSVELQDGTKGRPFGYKPTGLQPLRLAAIKSPSTAQALVDLDSGISSGSDAVTTPSHLTTRNHLYFDGHVAPVKVSQ